MSRKNDMHKAMCGHSTEENNNSYKSMRNKARKSVSKAMREMAEEELRGLKNCLGGMFGLLVS